MHAIWALAAKDLRLLVRDKAGLFFAFFFPILYAVFFGTIMGGMGDSEGRAQTSLLVVDHDRSPGAEAFITSLDEHPDLAVTRIDDRARAESLVRSGKHAAVIVIPEGFGSAARTIFTGEPMTLHLGIDPSRTAEAGLIEGLITAKAYERLQSLFTDFDAARGMARDALASVDAATDNDLNPAERLILKTFLSSLDRFLTELPDAQRDPDDPPDPSPLAFNPIQINSIELASDRSGRSLNAYAISFPQGIVWGIMGCAAAFGISLVSERNQGTLTRLRASPMPRSRVLLGKALACFLATMGVAVVLLALARLAFGVSPQSPPLLALAVACVCLAFVGIMMLLSTLGRTEASAGGIGWAVLLVSAMLGGGMIPLMFMKGWMITLSHASPVKWSILAIEGALWRNFTPAQMLLPCAILAAIGIAGFTLGARIFNWTER